MCRAIDGERCSDRNTVGSHDGKQSLVGDVLDRAAGHEEHSMLIGVRPDDEVDLRAAPGSDAIERRRRDDVSIDHRLPGHHAGHDLTTPARWVRTRGELGVQLRLGPKQAIERDRRDRLSCCVDPELLGEALADPLRGRR
jgi:hypothetical protein